MKKIFVLLLSLSMLVTGAAAEMSIELADLPLEMLVALRDQINLAIWNSQEWQEVTVPAGVWVIGKDIPEGHWTIKTAIESDYQFIYYFDKLDPTGLDADYSSYVFMQQIVSQDLADSGLVASPASFSIDMKDGWYIKTTGAMIFTPYAGKPDFIFK